MANRKSRGHQRRTTERSGKGTYGRVIRGVSANAQEIGSLGRHDVDSIALIRRRLPSAVMRHPRVIRRTGPVKTNFTASVLSPFRNEPSQHCSVEDFGLEKLKADNRRELAPLANAVFENESDADAWLNTPREVFENKSALEFATTDRKKREVKSELLRIEYGVVG